MTPERRLEILQRTRALLDHPSKWGRGTMVQHSMVDRLLMRPPRLCLIAAVYSAIHGLIPAVGEAWDRETSDIHDYLWGLVGEAPLSPYGRQLMSWQDRAEYADIVRVLEVAVLETELELSDAASSEDEQNQGHNRQDHEDRPEHESTVPPNG
jgi:hypothetical protein